MMIRRRGCRPNECGPVRSNRRRYGRLVGSTLHHHKQKFFCPIDCILSADFALIFAGVGFAAFCVLSTGYAEAGIIEGRIAALDRVCDTIGGDWICVFSWLCSLELSAASSHNRAQSNARVLHHLCEHLIRADLSNRRIFVCVIFAGEWSVGNHRRQS